MEVKGYEIKPRADLNGADLVYGYLQCANLRGAHMLRANLTGADLLEANLQGADLQRANLEGACLANANLTGACLYRADLTGADLEGANLTGADLRGAILSEATLVGANLTNVVVSSNTLGYHLACPESGRFIAYKKLRWDKIAKLEIPASAKRSSATTRKCRASKAKVLKIFDIYSGYEFPDGSSIHDGTVYHVGQYVYPDSYCEDRWEECAPGIHFFLSLEEAKSYK